MSFVPVIIAATGVVVFTISLLLAAPAQSQARTVTRDETSIARLLPASSVEHAAERQSSLALARSVRRLPAAPSPPTPAPAPRPTPAPAVSAAVLGISTGPGSTVIASWYGPGFYGNRTACGQLYTPQIMGVAHRTLPCGTTLRLEFRGAVIEVAVIDRGPFIAGRTLDLSNASRQALRCTDLCPVRMQLLH